MTPAHRLLAIKSLALAVGLTAGSAAALAQGAEPTPAPGTPVDPAAPTDPATDPVTTEPVPTDTLPTDPPVGEPAPEPEPSKEGPPAVEVFYDKGIGFKSVDDKFEAKLALRSQLRYEFERSTEDGAESLQKFSLVRVRLQLEGFVFGKDNRYKLEVGMGDRGSFAFVKDFFAERKAADKIWIRLGQWKRPFHRQEMISDFASTFNERSITNEFIGGGRDAGLAIHNDYEKSPEGVEWVFGVFNGFSGGSDRPRITTSCEDDGTGVITCSNSAATTVPADFSPAVVARVGYNQGAVKGYSEADLDGGPLRWGAAVNYKIDLADLTEGAEESTSDNLSHAFGFDAIAKVNGIDALVSAVGQKLKSADLLFGGLAQVGYMVAPKKMHVAGRFAFHQVEAGDDKEMALEGRVAFTYFLAGHALKIASDVGFLKITGVDGATVQVRIMPQLTF
jgi:hypothetical protein